MKTSRRSFLYGACAGTGLIVRGLSAAPSHVTFPSELKRFPDPATEFPIIRLTNPSHSSWLPSAASRFISRKSNFLLYTADRGGRIGLYRLDLKNGESVELALGEGLDHRFAGLTPDDKSCYYADGASLWMCTSAGNNAHARNVYHCPDPWRRSGEPPALTEDGIGALWSEQNGKISRLVFLSLSRSAAASTIAESPEPIGEVLPRPRRAGAMYRRGKELWLVSYDGQQNYKLRIAAPPFASPQWAADGRSLFYLSRPDAPSLVELRQFTPDTNDDQLIAKTSQYASFGRNGDSSVFVGVSGSKASPYVMLLVRAAKRELTVAEHKTSDAANAMPVFSPNSQRIFFDSDREGKHCIYSMATDKLVEETDEQ